jgi:hypothetical protein
MDDTADPLLFKIPLRRFLTGSQPEQRLQERFADAGQYGNVR